MSTRSLPNLKHIVITLHKINTTSYSSETQPVRSLKDKVSYNGTQYEMKLFNISISIYLFIIKQDTHHSTTYDSRTGHTRHI